MSSTRAAQTVPWERLTELEEHQALCRARVEHRVEVREPLVLISQIQRSGGTLLSQLFDGHPECHAHPHELKIGYPREFNWPPLDLARPEACFEVLFEKKTIRHFLTGYYKRGARKPGDTGKKNATWHPYDVFPFLFLPRLQKAIFDSCIAARPPAGERDVLDCYFTSYFNAWLDNHNLYTGPKRVVTGFTPRLMMEPGNVERFFSAYPDGALISIVRDPRTWFVSASGYKPERYADVEVSLGLWRQSTEAALDVAEPFRERVLVLTYEQLIEDPEATMRRIAERIGITMSPELLVPTFNGRPIRANSSSSVERYGILPERGSSSGSGLAASTADRIEELAGDLYERAAAVAAR